MASYRGHLMLSVPLGAAYAAWGFTSGLDPLTVGVGGVVTAGSGLLPDLDSDSGVPVRILFTMTALLVPGMILVRLLRYHLPGPHELIELVILGLFIRYCLSALFNKLTVHRGMFHSIPAVFIVGLAAFLLYQDPIRADRFFIAGGAMAGFLSHLVLDQLCNVNLSGGKIRLKTHAGPVLKLASSSRLATATAYGILICLIYLTAQNLTPEPRRLRQPPPVPKDSLLVFGARR